MPQLGQIVINGGQIDLGDEVPVHVGESTRHDADLASVPASTKALPPAGTFH
jgi:hypothetical protein